MGASSFLFRMLPKRHFHVCARSNVEEKFKAMPARHAYKNMFPWKRREELANLLLDNIVYNKDGLLVLNKPYGIAIYPTVPSGNENVNIVETLYSGGVEECRIVMSEVLPLLAEKLKVDELSIIKSPERYTSGLILLASNKQSKDKVLRSYARAKSLTIPHFTYWAITSQIPLDTREAKHKVGMKMVDVPEFNQKTIVIEKKPSINAVKSGAVKSVTVEYEVIDFNHKLKCGLVQISTSSIKWHFLRVFLAYKLAPVLGDSLYSMRVKNLLGKPAVVSPFNKACYDPPTLSRDMCNQLQLPSSAVQSIPTHLHLHKLTLNGYNHGKDLVLNASPYSYFLWTCKQLELSPDKNLKESVIIY